MTDINQKLLTGERVLFQAENMTITQSCICGWRITVKESRYIVLENDYFPLEIPTLVFT